MTSNKHWFSHFKPLNQGKVYMGNNQVCDVKGIGNIFIKMHDGVTRKLTEVRYVPDLRRNLISLGYLDSLGLSFKYKNCILRICKGNLVMLKGFKRESLYILIGKTVCNLTALISKTVPEKTMLWHRRIGHIRFSQVEGIDFNEIFSPSEKRDMANIPYRMAIGSVMYSMISTRPHITFSISLLSRFMSNRERDHWIALKCSTFLHSLEYYPKDLELGNSSSKARVNKQ
ncbi:hypothetical protein M9H77_01759 [Catharanthus roseus]|uniref:Uncharacterized protein n=1 Tax=Catharanthus roseus TaxID=4058 RepID=A0ACC0C6Q6_CATRO|nr:hypothetical protein M9H77_01759 [Catharanthus roseus]